VIISDSLRGFSDLRSSSGHCLVDYSSIKTSSLATDSCFYGVFLGDRLGTSDIASIDLTTFFTDYITGLRIFVDRKFFCQRRLEPAKELKRSTFFYYVSDLFRVNLFCLFAIKSIRLLQFS